MLMLLTPVVNFINILWASLLQVSFGQKNMCTHFQYRKAAQNIFIQKSCSKNVDETVTFIIVNFINILRAFSDIKRNSECKIK